MKRTARLAIMVLCAILGLIVEQSRELTLAEEITIQNRGYTGYRVTNVTDAGPGLGGILNAHYFPGLNSYRHGYFTSAKSEMDYFIDRPTYTSMNPRQGEYMSTAHYTRGMIYFYHATGLGRHVLAKRDFEQSIKWNPKNYLSYLELSRVWSAVGMKERAIKVLQNLLASKPSEDFAQLATQELRKLQPMGTKDGLEKSPESSRDAASEDLSKPPNGFSN